MHLSPRERLALKEKTLARRPKTDGKGGGASKWDWGYTSAWGSRSRCLCVDTLEGGKPIKGNGGEGDDKDPRGLEL